MSFLQVHINTAEKIIRGYSGSEPFHHYLKNFFREYKKAGSKDRRSIAHICYTYFRLGKALASKPFRERLAAAFLLCEPAAPITALLKSDLVQSEPDLDAIFRVNFPEYSREDIFPFEAALSGDLDRSTYAHSMLQQPDLHIRVRPGREAIAEKLRALEGFRQADGKALSFRNGTNIETVATLDKDVVIQGLSSQKVAAFFPDLPSRPRIWDACAASGGKSLLAVDHYKNPELTVTDKRSSIMRNLEQRFVVANLRNYKSMVTDLSARDPHKPLGPFDLVMADVPCSGSGTWGRNPENLSFFPESKVAEYQLLQRSILQNLLASVKQHGYLLYITCSVFRKENEDNVELIAENGFEIVRASLIEGAADHADNMFAALCRKK